MCTTAYHALVFICLSLCLSGCASEKPEPRPPAKPNIVLITLDTLRADHLGCYGYTRDTSPRIDAFAGRATLYTRSRAVAPWTIPTHASLFTGKLPFEHGAHTFKVARPRNNVNPLARRHLTLAEALQSEGYETGAFVANWAYMSTRWQLDQGFTTYHHEYAYAGKLNRHIFKWVDAHRAGPFFLFINYIDTHRPYNTTPRPGLLDRPVVRDQGQLLDLLISKVMPGHGPIPHALVRKVVDQYDTAIANVDEQFGALLDKLETMGVYDNTVIVVTSDHGEFLGEHHLVEHSKDVYEEVLWVPLIIKYPGQRAGEVRDTLVSSTDIPRLVLSQFPPDLAERYAALFPDAPGNHEVLSENYYTRTKDLFHRKWGHRFDRVRTVLYAWPYKYIRSSDGLHELFNLADDPGESKNLLRVQAGIAKALAQRLEQFQSSRQRSQGGADLPILTEEERNRLKSLGYIGN